MPKIYFHVADELPDGITYESAQAPMICMGGMLGMPSI
jgi:hypothetical protein